MQLREEPGKQKTGSCRAQELSRSRAQGKERRKWKQSSNHEAVAAPLRSRLLGKIHKKGSPIAIVATCNCRNGRVGRCRIESVTCAAQKGPYGGLRRRHGFRANRKASVCREGLSCPRREPKWATPPLFELWFLPFPEGSKFLPCATRSVRMLLRREASG